MKKIFFFFLLIPLLSFSQIKHLAFDKNSTKHKFYFGEAVTKLRVADSSFVATIPNFTIWTNDSTHFKVRMFDSTYVFIRKKNKSKSSKK
jgi:hypothetical protein